MSETSLRQFYAGLEWYLVVALLGVPLVVYGLIRGVVALGRWVWLGRPAMTRDNGATGQIFLSPHLKPCKRY